SPSSYRMTRYSLPSSFVYCSTVAIFAGTFSSSCCGLITAAPVEVLLVGGLLALRSRIRVDWDAARSVTWSSVADFSSVSPNSPDGGGGGGGGPPQAATIRAIRPARITALYECFTIRPPCL